MSAKYRIGFYCSSLSWGGLEMNMIRHARWMSELGWEVIIFCVKESRIASESEGLEVYLIARNKKYFDYKNATLLSKLIPAKKIDLVWIRDSRDMSTIGLAKRKSRNAFKILYQQAMQLGVDKKDFIHTRRFGRIDLWVSPLKFLAKQVEQRTNFPKERIRVIPLGIDLSSYDQDGLSKTEAREKLELPFEKKIIGVIGRFDPKKGQLFVLESLLKMRNSGLDLHLLMVGDKTMSEGPEYFDSIISFIKENNLEEIVHIRPFMKDVSVFYQGVDCFVMASEAETFGMVTLEAMLFALAIIGTNTSGTPELLENGALGYLFEPNNYADFSKQVFKVFDDTENAVNLGMKAQKSIRERYSHTIIIAKLEKEVQSLFE